MTESKRRQVPSKKAIRRPKVDPAFGKAIQQMAKTPPISNTEIIKRKKS